MYRVITAASSSDALNFVKQLRAELKKTLGNSFNYTPCKIVQNTGEISLRIYNSGDEIFQRLMSKDQLNQLIDELCNLMNISKDDVYVWESRGSHLFDNGYVEIIVQIDKAEIRQREKARAAARPGRALANAFIDATESKFNLDWKYIRGTKTSITISSRIPTYDIQEQVEEIARNSEGFMKLNFYDSDNTVYEYVGFMQVTFKRS